MTSADGPHLRAVLPDGPTSVRTARRLVEERCSGEAVDVDVAVLCTSELVTNALLHGAPPIELELRADDGGVWVGVHDREARVAEHRRPVSADTFSGRGLAIVEALTSAWGTDATPTGKVTWFRLAGAPASEL